MTLDESPEDELGWRKQRFQGTLGPRGMTTLQVWGGEEGGTSEGDRKVICEAEAGKQENAGA